MEVVLCLLKKCKNLLIIDVPMAGSSEKSKAIFFLEDTLILAFAALYKEWSMYTSYSPGTAATS